MKRQNRAYLYAFAAVAFWATVASAFKLSLRFLDFLQLLYFSAMSSLFVLFLIVIIQGKLCQLKKLTKRDLFSSALLGFLNPFLYYVILFKAYSLLSAQEAQALNYTWPIMLVLLSVPLLGQKMSLRSLAAICICFLGVCIISSKGDILGFRFTNAGGALLALSTAVIWALFWIYNVRDSRDEVVKLFVNFAFGLLYISIAVAVYSRFVFPDIRGFWGAVYVGLFEMGITFVVWSKALHLSETTAQVSKLIYFVPFLSLVIIHFLVGEAILLSTIVGLLLIVSGVVLEQSKSAVG